ncbi:S8 family serine peptidase [Pseudidiomarina sp. E22-M8]|uniref:S8 family serine peptidase n=1 Tax=Pseudidiomarina sp. E22-M8 TaxID=3424768 RepID=UPI00403CFF8A
MNGLPRFVLLFVAVSVISPAIALAQVLNELPQLPQELPQLPVTVERVENLSDDATRETLMPLRAVSVSTVEQFTAQLTDVIPEVVELTNSAGDVVLREVTVENGWRALEREWLVVIQNNNIAQLQRLPVSIIARQELTALQLTVIRFRVPAQYDSREALRDLLPDTMQESIARQHVYFAQSKPTDRQTPSGMDDDSKFACDTPVKLGVIDTRIKSSLWYFKDAQIRQRSFLDRTLEQPFAHGTAVAGLWLAQAAGLQPLLPKAELFAAEVFYQHNELSQGAPVSALIEALNWLVGEGIGVINMSMTGPDNPILKLVVERVQQQGTIIVAAAGNAGPAAPPLYPAAYSDVVAVTAVDAKQQIYRWANRGLHIDYAALGVAVKTIRPSGELTYESGTSMAAPVVSALLSCVLADQPIHKSVQDYLAPYLEDLGEIGPDPIFGRGLIRPFRSLN